MNHYNTFLQHSSVWGQSSDCCSSSSSTNTNMVIAQSILQILSWFWCDSWDSSTHWLDQNSCYSSPSSWDDFCLKLGHERWWLMWIPSKSARLLIVFGMKLGTLPNNFCSPWLISANDPFGLIQLRCWFTHYSSSVLNELQQYDSMINDPHLWRKASHKVAALQTTSQL